MALSLDTLLADHLLSAIVFLPLATVLLLALADGMFRLPETIWRYTALASSLVGLLLALALWQRFDPASSGMQLVEHADWIPSWGIHYSLGIDGIGLDLCTGLLDPTAGWVSGGIRLPAVSAVVRGGSELRRASIST